MMRFFYNYLKNSVLCVCLCLLSATSAVAEKPLHIRQHTLAAPAQQLHIPGEIKIQRDIRQTVADICTKLNGSTVTIDFDGQLAMLMHPNDQSWNIETAIAMTKYKQNDVRSDSISYYIKLVLESVLRQKASPYALTIKASEITIKKTDDDDNTYQINFTVREKIKRKKTTKIKSSTLLTLKSNFIEVTRSRDRLNLAQIQAANSNVINDAEINAKAAVLYAYHFASTTRHHPDLRLSDGEDDRAFFHEFFTILAREEPEHYGMAIEDASHGLSHSAQLFENALEMIHTNKTLSPDRAVIAELFFAAIFHDIFAMYYKTPEGKMHPVEGAKLANEIITNPKHQSFFGQFGDPQMLANRVGLLILRHDDITKNIPALHELIDMHARYFGENPFHSHIKNHIHNHYPFKNNLDGDIFARIFYFSDKLLAFDVERIIYVPDGKTLFDQRLCKDEYYNLVNLIQTDYQAHKIGDYTRVNRLAPLHREYRHHYHEHIDVVNIIWYTLFVKYNVDKFSDPLISEVFTTQYAIEQLIDNAFAIFAESMTPQELLAAYRVSKQMLAYYLHELSRTKREHGTYGITVWNRNSIGFLVERKEISKAQFRMLKRAQKYLTNKYHALRKMTQDLPALQAA